MPSSTITLSTTTPEGVGIHVPVDLSSMSDAEKAAFLKFSANGDLSTLSDAEKGLLADKKVLLQGEGLQAGLIARFDWHVVVV